MVFMRSLLRHNYRKAALDVLRSYVAQGKEPPPEVLAVLRNPHFDHHYRYHYRHRGHHGRGGAIILGCLALAFATIQITGVVPTGDNNKPFFTAAIILGALAIGIFISSRLTHHELEISDPEINDRKDPPSTT